jgi:raffinose/stachyose/melibiose transport system permease protein
MASAPSVGVRAPTFVGQRVRRELRRNGHVGVFLVPALVLVGVFYLLPTAVNFAYGFTNWSSYHSGVRWIGLQNFRDLSQDGAIWTDLWTTVKYALLVMVLENVVTLALALALERTSRANGLFRSIFFLPVLLSTLSAGYLWTGIVSTDGVLNRVLGGIVGHPVHTQWFGSTNWTIVVVAAIHAWRFGGIHMLVYIGALNAVPAELVEAAKVEGAGTWRIIRKIKLPLIGPAFTFNITLTLIGALSIFDLIFATTRGGPARATEVLNIFVWQQYGQGAFGYATAVSFILFLVICATAFPLIALLRRREVEL